MTTTKKLTSIWYRRRKMDYVSIMMDEMGENSIEMEMVINDLTEEV